MNAAHCLLLASPIRRQLTRVFTIAAFAISISAFAQQAADTPATRAATAQPDNATDARAERRAQRGNFSPEEIQQRLLASLREQLGVTDDAEWSLISDRVLKVNELRRASGGGVGGLVAIRAMMTNQNNGGNNRQNRGGFTTSPEQDALRQAIADKLPDAEIKARLERLREVRKQNEEKLTKAQDDLRAVLTVRQEAVVVLYGLVP